MNSIWIALLSAFLGTILGGLVSIITAVKIDEHKRKLEGRALTLAILTEIRVMVSLVEMRGYLQELRQILPDLRSGKRTSATLEVPFMKNPFPIFNSNRDKIGLLPAAIVSDVVKFYVMMESAIADVSPGGLLAANEGGEKEFSQLETIVAESLKIGGKILDAYPDKLV